MSAYKSYPKVADTKSRKNRKSARATVFVYNATLTKKARSEARRARKVNEEN